MSDETRQENGLPAGWVWTTLGEIADTTRKRVQPQEHPTLQFVGMEHVEAHTMRILNTVLASEMRSSAEYFDPGDVLYGRLRPYLNKVFCAEFTGLCSGEFIPFRKTSHLASKYLLYFLNSWEFASFASHLNEGDRPRVSFDQLAGYPFPLAPLPEQHRIVAEIETQFTRLDAGIAALKRVRANLRRYETSVLKAACEGRLVPTEAELARAEGRCYESASVLLERILVERRVKWQQANPGKRYVEPKRPNVDGLAELPEGWVWTSVLQLATKITDGTHKTPSYMDAGIPFLSVNNMTEDGGFSFSPCKYITEEEHRELYERCNPERGDVLLSKVGTVGLTAVLETEREFSLFVNTALIKPVGTLADPHFLAFALRHEFRSKLVESYVSGSTQKFIGTGKIGQLPVPLPPLQEQHRIVAEVERRLSVAQEVEGSVSAGLRRAERLRQSILKQAFAGRLTSRAGV